MAGGPGKLPLDQFRGAIVAHAPGGLGAGLGQPMVPACADGVSICRCDYLSTRHAATDGLFHYDVYVLGFW